MTAWALLATAGWAYASGAGTPVEQNEGGNRCHSHLKEERRVTAVWQQESFSAPNGIRAKHSLPHGRGLARSSVEHQMEQVIGVDCDAQGNIWVFHRSDPPILEFDPSGKLLTSFGNDMFVQAHGLAIDSQGNIWVTDAQGKDGKGQQVFKFSRDGKVLMTLGKAGVAAKGRTPSMVPPTWWWRRTATSSLPTARSR